MRPSPIVFSSSGQDSSSGVIGAGVDDMSSVIDCVRLRQIMHLMMTLSSRKRSVARITEAWPSFLRQPAAVPGTDSGRHNSISLLRPAAPENETLTASLNTYCLQDNRIVHYNGLIVHLQILREYFIKKKLILSFVKVYTGTGNSGFPFSPLEWE